MTKKAGIALLILLLSGCNSWIDTKTKHYAISVSLYDTDQEVYAVCGEGHNGCHKVKNGVHTIHAIRERCVFDHEIDHVFYGSFHKEPANCKTRAKQGAIK